MIPIEYQGYSYPKLFDNAFVHKAWKSLFCKRGWHLWDEVRGSGVHILFDFQTEEMIEEAYTTHYLFCDACDAVFGEV